MTCGPSYTGQMRSEKDAYVNEWDLRPDFPNQVPPPPPATDDHERGEGFTDSRVALRPRRRLSAARSVLIVVFVMGIWLFHVDEGLSWWGATWRSLAVLVVSVALGYGAASSFANRHTPSPTTVRRSSLLVTGLVSRSTWPVYLLELFPGAKAAAERHQHQLSQKWRLNLILRRSSSPGPSSREDQATSQSGDPPTAPWVVILLTLLVSGSTSRLVRPDVAELKRIVRDPGMSPVWHGLSLFVPIYNLFRIHAHFRTINAQSALRALPRKMAPSIAVTVAWRFLLVRASGYVFDDVTALVIRDVGALLLGAIFAIGQSELNSIWEALRAASERKPSTGNGSL